MNHSSERDGQPLIWYVTHGYTIRGGHEAHLLHFATEMRRRGFRTRLVVFDALPKREHLFMARLRQEGIPLSSADDAVRRISWAAAILLYLPWLGLRAFRGDRAPIGALQGYLREPLGRLWLSYRLWREKPAVIHILGRLRESAWSAFPPGRSILHHGTEGREDESWDPSEKAAFVAFAERAALNVAPGSGVAANLRAHFGIRRDISVIYTICPDLAGAPLPPGAAREPPSGRRFGILCRMTPEKGIDELLEALRLYRDRHGELDFTFAGTGPLDDLIRRHVESQGLRCVRRVTDFSSPLEVLRDIDVFVHPSRSDAMPMAIAEALMCGRPCLVTTVGGIPDLVRDGVEGIQVPPHDPAAIVAALERFAGMSAQEYAGFSARARARYEDVCRPESVGQALEAHYRAVMARA